MDLANIKPCVECKFFQHCNNEGLTFGTGVLCERLRCILVYGGDCFEEGDNG